MSNRQHTWALVLAAGEGSRLRSLTTDADGTAIPKQFCSLNGGTSLLLDTLRRASGFAPRNRISAVVAEAHRRWWATDLWSLPRENITVQPTNRGTANGILLPLLSILELDPFAKVVLLPSDHYFADEHVIGQALHHAIDKAYAHPQSLVLLGIAPEEADPELGYIVPGAALAEEGYRVAQFVEKPSPEMAQALIARGAAWNSFIFAADGNALLSIFRDVMPDIVDAMETARARDAARGSRNTAIAELYETLPSIDFSSRIAQKIESNLTLLNVPPCGWSDLGTPKRVAQTLLRAPAERVRSPKHARAAAYFSLAASHAQLQIAG
jgi:mannose-1-phosphate guanylyltransferase